MTWQWKESADLSAPALLSTPQSHAEEHWAARVILETGDHGFNPSGQVRGQN